MTWNRRLAVLSALLIAALSVAAQKPAPATDALESNLREHVQYLASDGLEGRRTGETGATTAAGYVANQFAQFKLKPGVATAKGKSGFLQPFPYVAGVSTGPGSKLTFNGPDGEKKLEAGVNYAPFSNSLNGEVANLPLVFAGFGISDKGYDDYAGLDVAGKIVLAFNGVPEGLGPHSEFAGMSTPMMASFAKDHGAKALILVAQSDDFKADPLSRLSYEPTLGDTAVPVVIIDRASAAVLLGVKDAKGVGQMEEWLRFRNSTLPNAKAVTRPVGGVPLGDLKATASLKVDLVKKTVDAYNVIGILEGTDPALRNEAIVIGAHYDHLGHGGQGSLSPNTSDIHHGADDNASGTAAVIELARQFAKEKKNKRTLIFMAFGGEEEGLLGSKYYINNPVWPLDKTVAMINLDMVGRLNESKLTVGGIGTSNEWKSIVEAKNSRYALNLPIAHAYTEKGEYLPIGGPKFEAFLLQLNEDGFGPSDHSSFYGKQIPVLFFFTGTHLDYHKPSDTFEKINYDGLAKITNYVAAIAKSVDENPTRPTYKVAQSSGNMTARTTFTISLGTIPNYAETNDGLGLDGVRDGGPAAKAGLKGGDKIIKMAGKDVRNISDYMFAMSTMKPNEEYEVVVKRGAETLTLKIVPAAARR